MKVLILSILLFLVFIPNAFSQGVVYSKEEANNLYGPVLTNVHINSTLLLKFINKTERKLMFRIDNGTLVILNNKRNQLYPEGHPVTPADLFRVFNVQLIEQIIRSGNDPATAVELRNNDIISLSNGDVTLEFGTTCPPVCD